MTMYRDTEVFTLFFYVPVLEGENVFVCVHGPVLIVIAFY